MLVYKDGAYSGQDIRQQDSKSTKKIYSLIVQSIKMSVIENIPVVDFSSILAASSADMKTLHEIEELRSAISGIGFVFLKNHGIDRKQVSACMMNSHIKVLP